jgi:hypothetical protein
MLSSRCAEWLERKGNETGLIRASARGDQGRGESTFQPEDEAAIQEEDLAGNGRAMFRRQVAPSSEEPNCWVYAIVPRREILDREHHSVI